MNKQHYFHDLEYKNQVNVYEQLKQSFIQWTISACIHDCIWTWINIASSIL